ncbi:MAG TPA: hypothetical protein VKT28_12155 [Puia sp.]|nr:hypothetical protein [Puia sp.]
MPITININDETATGKIINNIPITFDSELTTVREIIHRRVFEEVRAYNEKLPEYFNGLVQPVDAEKTLNGYKMKERRKVDPDKQASLALEAFNTNRYFILIDTVQSESLDQMVVINANTNISFIKLTPLVGG